MRLILLLALMMSQLQQKAGTKTPLPTTPKSPSITCSEADAAKACASFKQLVEAHDKDILSEISTKPAFVCFRPKEDAFVIFRVEQPIPSAPWIKDKDGKGENHVVLSSAFFSEYRNGVLYALRFGLQNWHRVDESSEPTYEYEATRGEWKGLKISIDGTEITVEYPFTNANSTTTEYSLTIRRSTGRFTETFASEKRPLTVGTGTCLIYR